MIQTKSDIIPGLILIKPDIFYDFRGEYIETFNVEKYTFFDEQNRQILFVEDDLSVSRYNVLKGMHGDERTWKLVQCIYGEFYVVIVDYRKNSSSYLKHESFILNDSNRYQILIPSGCANGHLCLSDYCIFSYKQSCSYKGSGKQFTLKWDDPSLGIHWPITSPILSLRDKLAEIL
jgi:dTDP-4-dehydrorhamnose 3,5-epimerase